MKTVLFVSPRFPPASAPDYHRLRVMLPLMQAHGWNPIVLCVASEFVNGPADHDLLQTIPSSIEVFASKAVPLRLSRPFGIGALSARAWPFLKSMGDQLLQERAIDLVFFSTTEFPFFRLGPRWLRKFNVPFVVDMQDPWVNPYYKLNGLRPPGGHAKHRVHQAYARHQEREVLASASHIISVSPQYKEDLMRRYPLLPESRFSVIPFSASESDVDAARAVSQDLFDVADGRTHWVYAGAVVPGMSAAIEAFFLALHRAWDEGIIGPAGLRIHFIGTDYVPGELATARVTQLARAAGVESFIEERPQRVPYLVALRSLIDADALLIFGSDDAGYTASKLLPYILARKPLLTVFHERSLVTSMVDEMSAGVSISFGEDVDRSALADTVLERWFASRAFADTPQTRWELFKSHSARAMTEQITAIFEEAL